MLTYQFKLSNYVVKFGKVLERHIFNSLYEFLHENDVLNESQSGFYSLVHVNIRSFQLYMIYMHLLTETHFIKSKEYF